jgi:DNA transformation protein
MASLGPVLSKRMFGGHRLFLEGLMFALVSDSILYFKTNTETAIDFQGRGLDSFSYEKKGKRCQLSYYQAPEECLESADDMMAWAQNAFNVARQANQKKR